MINTDVTHNHNRMTNETTPSKNIKIPLFISLPFGLAVMIMMIIWFSQYQGGYRWDAFSFFQQWNWHATLNTLGFSILLGGSILVFRTMKNVSRNRVKLVHVAIHIIAFILTTIGLSATFSLNTTFLYASFSSLHSWIGIITYILFILQFGCGIFTHMIPVLPRVFGNYHSFCGIALYGLVILTIVSGIMYRTTFVLNFIFLSSEQILINFMGLMFIIFSSLILYMVIHPKYK